MKSRASAIFIAQLHACLKQVEKSLSDISSQFYVFLFFLAVLWQTKTSRRVKLQLYSCQRSSKVLLFLFSHFMFKCCKIRSIFITSSWEKSFVVSFCCHISHAMTFELEGDKNGSCHHLPSANFSDFSFYDVEAFPIKKSFWRFSSVNTLKCQSRNLESFLSLS